MQCAISIKNYLTGGTSMRFLLAPFAILGFIVTPSFAPPNIPATEDSIREITNNVEKLFDAQNVGAGKNGKLALRTFHAKGSCVYGEMYVNENLPGDLRVGLFNRKALKVPIPVYGRFAPGMGIPHSDREKDPAYSLTVHATGIEGERFIEGEAFEKNSQTWVTANYPIFFVPTAAAYVDMSRAMKREAEGDEEAINKYLLTHPKTALIAAAMKYQKLESPFHRRYWSQTPYKFGNKDAKWSFTPCHSDTTTAPPSDDMFEELMTRQLKKGTVCFDLSVQFSLDPKLMPVDDPTVWWPEPGYWNPPFAPGVILKRGIIGAEVQAMLDSAKADVLTAGREARSEFITFLNHVLPANHQLPIHPPADQLPTKESQFHSLAKIYFKPTPSPAQLRTLCEHMVNNPGQALKVFRPQAFVNEARSKSIYPMGSRKRLEINKMPHIEPSGDWQKDIEAFEKAAAHLHRG
jgi:hypothetical protein